MSDFGKDRYEKMVGRKVLAVNTINNERRYVEVLGRGTFLGVFPPDTALGNIADDVRELGELNPKIELNDGQIVWGCECWWMDAYRGDMWLAELASIGYEIRDVSISDLRADYTERLERSK